MPKYNFYYFERLFKEILALLLSFSGSKSTREKNTSAEKSTYVKIQGWSHEGHIQKWRVIKNNKQLNSVFKIIFIKRFGQPNNTSVKKNLTKTKHKIKINRESQSLSKLVFFNWLHNNEMNYAVG